MLAGAAAAAAGSVIGVPLLGVELAVQRQSGLVDDVTLVAVVGSSLVAGVAGWAVMTRTWAELGRARAPRLLYLAG